MSVQIAYSDASVRPAKALRARRVFAALGVVIDGVAHSRVQSVASVAEAELRAAGYAVSLARPGRLSLHVDCALSATLLRDPRGQHPLIWLARSAHRLARLRGVEIEVIQIPGRSNPAHQVAYGCLQNALSVRRRSVTPGVQG